MPRWSRYLSWALFVLFVLAAAVWTTARLATPTAGQRTVMALLEQPGEFPGRNAFGLMYTADRAVPVSEIDALLAEEARRVEQHIADHRWMLKGFPSSSPPSSAIGQSRMRRSCK